MLPTLTQQIEAAHDLAALSQAASQITGLMAAQHYSGTPIVLLAQQVQHLNARLFERAWQLVAPADLVAHSCLLVMGSEGRGEQLLKTDQDNALILHDDYAPPADLAVICQHFSQALADFGYPLCPGHIMVSNPQWRRQAREWGQVTRQWLLMPDTNSLMNLAIFMDAQTVCGDARLLQEVQHGLRCLATDNDIMLSRFAAAVDAFGDGADWAHWWPHWLHLGDAHPLLNLKKAGIFPLVHGVRSLALAHHVLASSTTARLERLVQDGHLSAAMGQNLIESLHFLMALKLQSGLVERASQQPVTGMVNTSQLSLADQAQLKVALAGVRRFKAWLRPRFHLDV